MVQITEIVETERDDLVKPTDLPIYENTNTENETPKSKRKQGEVPQIVCHPSDLEKAVSTVRKTVWHMHDLIRLYKSELIYRIQDSARYPVIAYHYLSKECDDRTRKGAITASTVTGFTYGLRGGLFRRIFYTLVGGLGMAAVCYPEPAQEYCQDIITYSTKYYKLANDYWNPEPEENIDGDQNNKPQESNVQQDQPIKC